MNRQNAADRLVRTRVHRHFPRLAAVARIILGGLYVWYGVDKFTGAEGWASGFAAFGLPESPALVYAVGAAELLGGIALIVGLATPVVAALLALLMVGAALFGGILPGNTDALAESVPMLVATLVVLASTGLSVASWRRSTVS